jgi:hypothetical protein
LFNSTSDRAFAELRAESRHLLVIGDIERIYLDGWIGFGQGLQWLRLRGVATAGKHRPFIGRELCGQFQANAAISPGYHNGWTGHKTSSIVVKAIIRLC